MAAVAPVTLAQPQPTTTWRCLVHPAGWSYYEYRSNQCCIYSANVTIGIDKLMAKLDFTSNAAGATDTPITIVVTRRAEEYDVYVTHCLGMSFRVDPEKETLKYNCGTRHDTQDPKLIRQAKWLFWKHARAFPHLAHGLPLHLRHEADNYLSWCSFAPMYPDAPTEERFTIEEAGTLQSSLSRIEEVLKSDKKNGEMKQENEETETLFAFLVALVLFKKYDIIIDRQGLNLKSFQEYKLSIGSLRLSERDTTKDQSPVFFFLVTSAMLLFIPFHYLEHLLQIRSSLLPDARWRQHVERLKKEWENISLLASLLISSAVVIVGIEGDKTVYRVAILICILLAFGSIISCFYCTLIYHDLAPDTEYYSQVQTYVVKLIQNTVDQKEWAIHTRAIILSLPMAFFIWSLVAFITSILAIDFLGTDQTFIRGTSYAVLAVGALVVLVAGIGRTKLEGIWRSTGDGNGEKPLWKKYASSLFSGLTLGTNDNRSRSSPGNSGSPGGEQESTNTA